MSNTPRQSYIPADTSRDAFRAEVEALRRLGIQGRARLTFDLIEQLQTTTEAGIRDRHPEYTPAQVRMARNRIWWGEALFRRVYPGVDIAI